VDGVQATDDDIVNEGHFNTEGRSMVGKVQVWGHGDRDKRETGIAGGHCESGRALRGETWKETCDGVRELVETKLLLCTAMVNGPGQGLAFYGKHDKQLDSDLRLPLPKRAHMSIIAKERHIKSR